MADPAVYDLPYLPEPAADHAYDVVPELGGGAGGDGGGGGGGDAPHVYDPYVAPPYAPYDPAGVDLSSLMNAHPGAADAAPPPAPALAPAAPARDVHDPFGKGPGHLLGKSLLPEYRGEDQGTHTSTHMPDNIAGMATPYTAYANNPDAHAATVEGGKLMRGGAAADSSGVQPMWRKDKAERLNFAMDTHGGMNLSDPKQDFIGLRNERRAAGETTTGRINHSTMVAGGDVAGAGTVRMRDGKVESLGDGSGHYQPSITHTAQVAETLAGAGVMDPARSSIELGGKGKDDKGNDQKELLLSTQELLSYGSDFAAAKTQHAATGDEAALAAPEATIRKRHAAKDDVMADIRARGAAAGAGGSAGMLSQLRSEKPHQYDVIDELGGGAAGGHHYDMVDELGPGYHVSEAADAPPPAPLPPTVAGEPAPDPSAAHLSNLTDHYAAKYKYSEDDAPAGYAPYLTPE